MQRTIDRYLLHEVQHHPGPYNGRLREMQRLEALGLVRHDGRGWVLTDKGVGEMDHSEADFYAMHAQDDVDEARAEMQVQIDALQAVVVQQCEAMAEMMPASEVDRLLAKIDELQEVRSQQADEIERLEEYEQYAGAARYYLEGYMLAMFGERRPVRPIEPPELRALVTFIYEGS